MLFTARQAALSLLLTLGVVSTTQAENGVSTAISGDGTAGGTFTRTGSMLIPTIRLNSRTLRTNSTSGSSRESAHKQWSTSGRGAR